MRIRKNAKFSPLQYASSSLNPGALVQTHVCQLNQSPWDVMTFSPPSSPPPPPPPSKANGSGVGVGNGSSDCFISVAERELSSRRRSEYWDAATSKDDAAPPPVKNEGAIICCKTDGKSWQCRREAAEGNSLCEHHLSLVKSYSSVAHHAAKKSVKPPPAEAQRRNRPKKAPASSSSNPYEFYYYSGFGPRWGKRRSETTLNNCDGSIMPKNLGEANVEVETPPPAGKEDFDFSEYEDEDDDEEDSRDNGKKRVRKRIKARSLKSLL